MLVASCSAACCCCAAAVAVLLLLCCCCWCWYTKYEVVIHNTVLSGRLYDARCAHARKPIEQGVMQPEGRGRSRSGAIGRSQMPRAKWCRKQYNTLQGLRTGAGTHASGRAGQHFELFDSILRGVKTIITHNHSLHVQYVRICQEFDRDK